jgi:hypothetical protein
VVSNRVSGMEMGWDGMGWDVSTAHETLESRSDELGKRTRPSARRYEEKERRKKAFGGF